jgi:hypothetical protein
MGFLPRKMFFTRKSDDPSIKEYIKHLISLWKNKWRLGICLQLKDDATKWEKLFNFEKMKVLSYEAYEQVFLDRWSHVGQKDKESTNGLFSYSIFLLLVHGCIQQERVIVSINTSCNHNFININLAKIV